MAYDKTLSNELNRSAYMRLQGRDLSPSMQDPDVAGLQRELRKLSFTISPAEFQRKIFRDGKEALASR